MIYAYAVLDTEGEIAISHSFHFNFLPSYTSPFLSLPSLSSLPFLPSPVSRDSIFSQEVLMQKHYCESANIPPCKQAVLIMYAILYGCILYRGANIIRPNSWHLSEIILCHASCVVCGVFTFLVHCVRRCCTPYNQHSLKILFYA